ncbi:polysaccharide deacetylase family protein [Alicyclobacillus ferrooxydans]|uniref:NodB homology domain-containing protein n=1 Tax=Alicyclobacillus ferrooxydans TaxID=471514 RepID=A0A0P9GQ05_9BACL|nr:polysaccharide deacetylase family protein [Alicyclobacillus ferrooxydans]KPV42810.1 hypothetical protein AN477_15870 [Alicyclobacillus ferrooxydans]
MDGWTWLIILAIVVLVWVLYTLLPELLFHIWHIGTLFHGNPGPRRVALTFDDGPDPRYTSQVLSILAEEDVKATFFLVAERAAANPSLVAQIVAGGHDIGSHSYRHHHHWFRDPVTTFLDMKRSKETLERMTGRPIRFYRPPWGAFNWFTKLTSLKLGLRPTLWSARAIDWLPGDHATEVEQRVIVGAHPGAIVLCHDAGGAEGAPRNTITALPQAIEQLRRLGYEFSTVSEMSEAWETFEQQRRSLYRGYPLWRRMLIGVWAVVELAFARMYHVQGVNEIFRIGPMVWHHGPRVGDDSTVMVREGAPGLDLHFRNETLIAISSAADQRSLVRGLRQVKEGLRDIARMIVYHPGFQNIEVVAAPTLMNRGIEMLGFHVEDLPKTKENRRLQRYMKFLMGMYHPEGFRRLREGTRELEIKLVWMSREELFERTGVKPVGAGREATGAGRDAAGAGRDAAAIGATEATGAGRDAAAIGATEAAGAGRDAAGAGATEAIMEEATGPKGMKDARAANAAN